MADIKSTIGDLAFMVIAKDRSFSFSQNKF